jgi:hypothetical protein
MSDWCPTRAGCYSLPRPVDAERCNCTAPFADTHRPPPTFADGTDRTMFSFGRGMGLAGWQRSKIPIVLSVASRPARELTVRSAKPGIKSTLDANCTDGDASLMITAQQRRHPHRQGLAAGALSADCRIFTYRGSRGFARAIPCSAAAQQRHKIIRKGVALLRDESVSVVPVGTTPAPTGDPTHAHLHHRQ